MKRNERVIDSAWELGRATSNVSLGEEGKKDSVIILGSQWMLFNHFSITEQSWKNCTNRENEMMKINRQMMRREMFWSQMNHCTQTRIFFFFIIVANPANLPRWCNLLPAHARELWLIANQTFMHSELIANQIKDSFSIKSLDFSGLEKTDGDLKSNCLLESEAFQVKHQSFGIWFLKI